MYVYKWSWIEVTIWIHYEYVYLATFRSTTLQVPFKRWQEFFLWCCLLRIWVKLNSSSMFTQNSTLLLENPFIRHKHTTKSSITRMHSEINYGMHFPTNKCLMPSSRRRNVGINMFRWMKTIPTNQSEISTFLSSIIVHCHASSHTTPM